MKNILLFIAPIATVLLTAMGPVHPFLANCVDKNRCVANSPWLSEWDYYNPPVCINNTPVFTVITQRDQHCVCDNGSCVASSHGCLSTWLVTADLAAGCSGKPDGYGCMYYLTGSSNEISYTTSVVGCGDIEEIEVPLYLETGCTGTPHDQFATTVSCSEARDCTVHTCPDQ